MGTLRTPQTSSCWYLRKSFSFPPGNLRPYILSGDLEFGGFIVILLPLMVTMGTGPKHVAQCATIVSQHLGKFTWLCSLLSIIQLLNYCPTIIQLSSNYHPIITQLSSKYHPMIILIILFLIFNTIIDPNHPSFSLSSDHGPMMMCITMSTIDLM